MTQPAAAAAMASSPAKEAAAGQARASAALAGWLARRGGTAAQVSDMIHVDALVRAALSQCPGKVAGALEQVSFGKQARKSRLEVLQKKSNRWAGSEAVEAERGHQD